MAISPKTTVVSSKGSVFCPLDGDTIILNLTDGQYYELNPVAGWIWGHIQEPRSVSSLLEMLVEEYSVETNECERDVKELLQEMAATGLIEVTNESAS
ncbi:MAG: PqqD family peptide modification chaperone [Candidatus Sumerlaeota bacterium]|nr:PqqD family peptide modification chaperone [Candidatus Sumerlaeota bacterium]